ncbi:hypothetical protein [Afipia sp. Root123D2]|nr:hypothetical protein [Afipia sp. Root123D2]
MAGPVPAIRVLVMIQEGVDARHKAGHDEIKLRIARLRRAASNKDSDT